MNLHHNELFQAILNNPDGDTPRLVYADWLEENGDPDRAELIRIGCELPGHEAKDIAPGLPELRIRHDQLIRKHREAWKVPKYPKSKILWQHGFLTLEGSPESFATPAGVEWWEQHKDRIGWVTWTGKKLKPGVCEQLPPDLVARTTEIRRTGETHLRQDEFEEIARYPNLRKLECPCPTIDADTAARVWASLVCLTALRLRSRKGTDALDKGDIEPLVALKNLRKLVFQATLQRSCIPPLRELVSLEELDFTKVFQFSAKDFAELEPLTNLQTLRILYPARTLQDSIPCNILPPWPELRELRLLAFSTKEELASLDRFPKLEKLTVLPNVSSVDLQAMPSMPELRCLALTLHRYSMVGFAGLSKHLKLRDLCFKKDSLAVDELKKLPRLERLEVLEGPEPLQRQVAKILVERFPNVKQIRFPRWKADGVEEHLTKLEHVETLVLRYPSTKDWNTVSAFQKVKYLKVEEIQYWQNVGSYAKQFPALEVLDLRGAETTKETFANLKKDCPNVAVLK